MDNGWINTIIAAVGVCVTAITALIAYYSYRSSRAKSDSLGNQDGGVTVGDNNKGTVIDGGVTVGDNIDGPVIIGNQGTINIGISEEKLDSILSEMEKGQEEWKKKYEEVVSSFERFRQELSNDSDIHEAISEFNQGNFDGAIGLREKYAADYSDRAEENYYELGNLYLLQFDHENALANYQKADEVSESKNLYAYKFADILVKMGHFEKAEEILLQKAEDLECLVSLGMGTPYYIALRRLAELYIVLGKKEQAQSTLDKIKSDAKFNSGEMAQLLDDTQNKINALSFGANEGVVDRLKRLEEKWGKYAPEIVEPANVVAQAYDAESNYEAAEALYERIFEICKSSDGKVDPKESGVIKINYAFNQFHLDKLENVERCLDEAIEALSLNHPWIKNILLKAVQEYMDRDRFEEAKKYIRIYIEILKIDEAKNKEEILQSENLIRELDG